MSLAESAVYVYKVGILVRQVKALTVTDPNLASEIQSGSKTVNHVNFTMISHALFSSNFGGNIWRVAKSELLEFKI